MAAADQLSNAIYRIELKCRRRGKGAQTDGIKLLPFKSEPFAALLDADQASFCLGMGGVFYIKFQ